MKKKEKEENKLEKEEEKEENKDKNKNKKERNLPLGLKHSLLYEGINWKEISIYEDKIDELKKKAIVPPNYTIFTPIQLLPERVIDTTNRSLVLDAQKDGFDPDGFKSGKPLQKDLFYMNPYITCSWCNTMNYVDVIAVRRMLTLPDSLKDKIQTESLPPCEGCGRADGFAVGANDFMELIERRKREEEERKQRILSATIKLQRMYRCHLRYMYGYAYNRKMLARAKLIHRAASQIQAICRVRLCRRIFKTEKNLVIIKTAHPRLLAFALAKKPGKRATFWYKTALEIKLLYEDYVNLASRTGFQPARLLVERNIAEIAKRIFDRQTELVTLVQKRWRGVMTRRIVKLYRIEKIRLRQWYVSFILKIQRTFRGHSSRLKIPIFKDKWFRDNIMNKYLDEKEEKKRNKDKKWLRDKTHLLYLKQRKEEFTARVTGKIDGNASEYDGKKMIYFDSTCYSDDYLKKNIIGLVENEIREIEREKNIEQNQRDRKQFIVDRIQEHGPKGYGKRGYNYSKAGIHAQPPQNNVKAFLKNSSSNYRKNIVTKEFVSEKTRIKNLNKRLKLDEEVSLRKIPSTRSKGMNKLFESELTDIINKEIEKASHDFTKKNLLGRFREHRESGGMRNGYKYPTSVYEDPMKWLNDDIDVTIQYQDTQMKLKRTPSSFNK